ncbi:hypothetical protein [Candidatus Similichlamydia laticola]|nr:hypothetical protein [Candidatus Similichlamydia laticola]
MRLVHALFCLCPSVFLGKSNTVILGKTGSERLLHIDVEFPKLDLKRGECPRKPKVELLNDPHLKESSLDSETFYKFIPSIHTAYTAIKFFNTWEALSIKSGLRLTTRPITIPPFSRPSLFQINPLTWSFPSPYTESTSEVLIRWHPAKDKTLLYSNTYLVLLPSGFSLWTFNINPLWRCPLDNNALNVPIVIALNSSLSQPIMAKTEHTIRNSDTDCSSHEEASSAINDSLSSTSSLWGHIETDSCWERGEFIWNNDTDDHHLGAHGFYFSDRNGTPISLTTSSTTSSSGNSNKK